MASFNFLQSLVRKLTGRPHRAGFESSSRYWLERYAHGGNSGAGSYNHLAEFKANFLNTFVVENEIESVIEFGCGDGNQLRYARYPRYFGLDISPLAVEMCAHTFASDHTKRFALLRDYQYERADLALSLDVIYHLVEDSAFESHMRQLFDAAWKFVVIYSSDSDVNEAGSAPHVRHRRFSNWVHERKPNWRLLKEMHNPYPYDGDYTRTTFAQFFVYARQPDLLNGGILPDAP